MSLLIILRLLQRSIMDYVKHLPYLKYGGKKCQFRQWFGYGLGWNIKGGKHEHPYNCPAFP